jgi:hypothetical protein
MADAFTEEVLAVMVRFPGATAGMVMPVLKAPAAVVLKEKVADPAMTVPVVEGLKPAPETVTAAPAGPCAGFSVICAAAAGAAWAGWIPASAKAAPTPKARTTVFNVRNKAISPPRSRRGLGHGQAVLDALALILDAKPAVPSRKPQFFSKTLTGRGNGPNLKKETCLQPPPRYRSGRPQRKGPS